MKFKLSILGLGFLLIFSIPLLSQYAPFYVLDGYGGVHAGGGAPAISPTTPYFGWDIAKSIDYVPVASSSGNYGDGILVLDGYGGIHKGGKLSGITITATPYFGFNIARSIAYRVVDPEAFGTSTSMTYQSLDESMNTIGSFYMCLPDAGWAMLRRARCCGILAIRFPAIPVMGLESILIQPGMLQPNAGLCSMPERIPTLFLATRLHRRLNRFT